MTECRLMLPYPPSVNNYKRIGRTIRTKSGKFLQTRVNSPKTTAFYSAVWNIIRKEGLKSFDGAAISMQVMVMPPDKRKRDLDNILKVLIDSLQFAQIFNDDSQIARLLVQRGSIIKQGAIYLVISTMEDTL